MKPSVCARPRPSRRGGYTLIEMLVATAMALMLLVAASQVFAWLGESVGNSRATVETMDALRAAQAMLRKDLVNHTCNPLPPARVDDGEGYVEVLEGAYTAATTPGALAVDKSISSATPDTTVGDVDDMIALTVQSRDKPFRGLLTDKNGTLRTVESQIAEVVWFTRGNVLLRRVLLVLPGTAGWLPNYSTNYFAGNDISVRTNFTNLYPNTLGDLTKREWRYGHNPTNFPFFVPYINSMPVVPTLGECSASWPCNVVTPTFPIDYWQDEVNIGTGPRTGEDVVLRNVIGFDVKVWDQGAGTYVDINGPDAVLMKGAGPIYCSFSDHYEKNGVDEDGQHGADQAFNGFDDNSDGAIDNASEREVKPGTQVDSDGDGTADAYIPLYPVPLRGVQIKIRVFEPDSRNIMEVTVAQDFLPK